MPQNLPQLQGLAKFMQPPWLPVSATDPGLLPDAPAAHAQLAPMETQACAKPPFSTILSDSTVQDLIRQDMAKAPTTPNRGLHGDIPDYGSEYGFFAGIQPTLGVLTGPDYPSDREREIVADTDNKPFLPVRDLTFIHTHQSPRSWPDLSRDDVRLALPMDGSTGMNIVSIGPDGTPYCFPAGRRNRPAPGYGPR